MCKYTNKFIQKSILLLKFESQFQNQNQISQAADVLFNYFSTKTPNCWFEMSYFVIL